jgi:hypothetical protein
MNEQHMRDFSSVSQERAGERSVCVTASAQLGDQELVGNAGFSEAEMQRLIFLRWLYTTGLVSEWTT